MRSEGRTRVIAEQVWEGELFACLAQPCHCIVLLMTLARGTLYAEQAIHCEESHNSTFNKVHLIACPPCVLQYKLDICPQLHGGEGRGEVKLVAWRGEDISGQQPTNKLYIGFRVSRKFKRKLTKKQKKYSKFLNALNRTCVSRCFHNDYCKICQRTNSLSLFSTEKFSVFSHFIL